MDWSELSTSATPAILEWAQEQAWCQHMAACQQDQTWHAEGDVWTHTKLVCSQLPLLEGWGDLTPREQTVLLFTALFHDAGKPLTSRSDPDSGRITSPKHAVKGEHLCRNVLRDLNCDLMTREEIARLVRFHGRPVFLLEKPDPDREVISLSWLVPNKLLYLFALADTRGRVTSDSGHPEENVHLWKLLAEENNCFHQPYPFASAHSRFLYFHREKPDLHYVPFEGKTFIVTMMSGLPGSGKDNWLSRLSPPHPVVVSLDQIRADFKVNPWDDQGGVIQEARKRCKEILRYERPFTFNATNLTRQTRRRWIDLFANYGARVEIVYIEPPLPVILRQNRGRSSPVPEWVIKNLAFQCEPPTATETHDLQIWGASGDSTCSRLFRLTNPGDRL